MNTWPKRAVWYVMRSTEEARMCLHFNVITFFMKIVSCDGCKTMTRVQFVDSDYQPGQFNSSHRLKPTGTLISSNCFDLHAFWCLELQIQLQRTLQLQEERVVTLLIPLDLLCLMPQEMDLILLPETAVEGDKQTDQNLRDQVKCRPCFPFLSITRRRINSLEIRFSHWEMKDFKHEIAKQQTALSSCDV